MNLSHRFRPAAVLILALALACSLSPSQAGEAVLEQNFDGASELPASFRAVKGEWTVADGVLVGSELAADKHAAVLNFGGKNTDSVVSLRFRLDGATFVHLSLNHAKGHLFRVILDPAKGLSINKDKNKKDPESKAIVLGTQAGPISSGEWHNLKVAIDGDKVTATLDDGEALAVSHEGLDVAKPGYRLVLKGKTVSIDDIRVTAAKADS